MTTYHLTKNGVFVVQHTVYCTYILYCTRYNQIQHHASIHPSIPCCDNHKKSLKMMYVLYCIVLYCTVHIQQYVRSFIPLLLCCVHIFLYIMQELNTNPFYIYLLCSSFRFSVCVCVLLCMPPIALNIDISLSYSSPASPPVVRPSASSRSDCCCCCCNFRTAAMGWFRTHGDAQRITQ